MWALACITYECFTGTTVWSTDEGVAMTFAQIATAPLPDPRSYRPDLPHSFDAWFRKALHRDIKERFQSVREFADELAAAFGHTAAGGGLDVGLVNLITNRATHGVDADAVTVRRSYGGPPPVPHISSLEPERGFRRRLPLAVSVALQRGEQLSLSMTRPQPLESSSRWDCPGRVGRYGARRITAERPAPSWKANAWATTWPLASTDRPR